MPRWLAGRVHSYVLEEDDVDKVETLPSYEEPKRQSSFLSFIRSASSKADDRVDEEDDRELDDDGRLLEPSASYVIPDIEVELIEPSASYVISDIKVEYGKSRDAISVLGVTQNMKSFDANSPSQDFVERSPSFGGSIMKSLSRGIQLVKSSSQGESILKSPSYMTSIQGSPSLRNEPSAIGFEEAIELEVQASSSGIANGDEPSVVTDKGGAEIAVPASPSRIAKGDEPSVVTDKGGDAIGLQATPSKIAKGDEPTIVGGDEPTIATDHDLGFEVEIKPTPNLAPPGTPDTIPEGKEEMSHASSLTDTAAGEPIPKHIGLQHKDKKHAKRISQLEYYRQREATKEKKPKKPGKNIFGLRRKGDPYCSDKTAAKKANRNFMGFRPRSTVEPCYKEKGRHPSSRVSKSSRSKTVKNEHNSSSDTSSCWGLDDMFCFPLCFADKVEEETEEYRINDKPDFWDSCLVFPTFVAECVQKDIADLDLNMNETPIKQTLDEIKAEQEDSLDGDRNAPKETAITSPTSSAVANKRKDDGSWSTPFSAAMKSIGSTSLFAEGGSRLDSRVVEIEPTHQPRSSVLPKARASAASLVPSNVAGEKSVSSNVTNGTSVISAKKENSATSSSDAESPDTLKGLILNGLAGPAGIVDYVKESVVKESTRIDEGIDGIVDYVKEGRIENDIDDIVNYMKESVRIDDGIDSIANIVQTEAAIQDIKIDESAHTKPTTNTKESEFF